MTKIKCALAGLGNVGVGVLQMLETNKQAIFQNCGAEFEIIAVSARDKIKDRGVDVSKILWVDQPLDLLKTDCEIVLELMGGDGDPALSFIQNALQSGKKVVTANKSLLAKHGKSLSNLVMQTGGSLGFEAAVAGGIPIIKMMSDHLSGSRLTKIYGILNGTCNYILTEMEQTGRSFEDVLREAQQKGYAEAEPSLDVDGFDTSHKIALLSALAFGMAPDLLHLPVSGIRAIRYQDIEAARELGYRIKLLGMSEQNEVNEICQTVEPCLVPLTSPLAHTNSVLNAVYTEGNFVGASFVSGRGAGSHPTAASVVADLMDIAKNQLRSKLFETSEGVHFQNPQDQICDFYLRLVVLDKPGVIADVAAILRDHAISIESLIQRGRDPNQPVSVILTTHKARTGDVHLAAQKIEKLPSCVDRPLILKLLNL
jgi:homoserine dehydrogenase